ncbi:MAG: hypothetical protein ACPGU9_07660 [Flavobacteriaceae bacterium]
MKIIVIIFSICVLTSCCASKKGLESEVVDASTKDMSVAKLNQGKLQEAPLVIYDSHTRGYHFTATVYNTYLTVTKTYNGKPETIEVSPKDIEDLKTIISELSLQNINKHEAPTKKRHYDGAPHTTISVISNGEKFTSQTFDGGFPPKALEVLVNKVLSLSPEK